MQTVCLSTSNWYPFPTRKQHIMSRLEGAEILYFDPPVTLLAPFKDRKTFSRLFAWLSRGQNPKENIRVYALPPVLPFFNKYRFINKINQRILALFVNRKIVANGFSNPLLWCYSPTSADILKHIQKSGLVYDCVDRHSAYKGLIRESVVGAMEKDLAERADFVFATAAGLFETLKEYNENTFLIPNGVNFEHFSKGGDVPSDMRGLKKPVFCFAGMLQECIDYEKIRLIAEERQEWTVALIGGHMPGVNLEHLKKYPNIRFLGMKKYDDMPAYLAACDVFLNIFREGSLSRDVSPLKFYEYLACGKPVVSTPQPEQVLEYEDVVYIAESDDDFIEKCEKALIETGEEKNKKRIAYAAAASWDARVWEMEDLFRGKSFNDKKVDN